MNKTCIITGATDGIGKQTAIDLASLGYSIGLVGRDQDKGELVLNEIADATNNQSLKFFKTDLSKIKSIKALSDEIKSEYDSIEILVNNAGAYFSDYIQTEEGLEMTFALNHLNYFRMTLLLMDIINSLSSLYKLFNCSNRDVQISHEKCPK